MSQTQLVRADGSVPRLVFPTASGRAVFFARPHLSPDEMPDADYPFLLNTGRLPHQWHTMTKTGKVAKLNKLNPGPFVEIHPDDAARLDVSEGDKVEIASRRGRAVLPAVITDRVRPGNCFARSTGTTCSANTCQSTRSLTTRWIRCPTNRSSKRARSP